MKKFALFALAFVLLCMSLSGCTTLIGSVLGNRVDTVIDSTVNVITSDEADPELIAAMADYEAQMDDYVAFMNRYHAAEDKDALQEEYEAYQLKYGQILAGLNDLASPGMSQADAAYYSKAFSRIMSKVATIGDTESTVPDSSNLDPEFVAKLNDLEMFFDEYITLFQRMQANPTDTDLLAEYFVFAETYGMKMAELENMKGSELTDEEMAYYQAIMNRIKDKLQAVTQ